MIIFQPIFEMFKKADVGKLHQLVMSGISRRCFDWLDSLSYEQHLNTLGNSFSASSEVGYDHNDDDVYA